VQLHGFAFLSIARLNDYVAVTGSLRDLNHHLPLFSDMARITLADWTCSISHCQPPLLASSPSFERSYARFIHTLPRAWIVAHSVLRDLRLSISDTDLSYLLTGQLSLQHLARSALNLLPHSGVVAKPLTRRSAGVLYLCNYRVNIPKPKEINILTRSTLIARLDGNVEPLTFTSRFN
jgi:hypothetical protein